MYSTFKLATKKSTKCVTAMKMVARAEVRKKADGHDKQSREYFVHCLEVYLNEQEGSANNLDDDLHDKDEDCAVTLKVG